MKIGKLAIAAGVMALGTAAWLTPGHAQGPMYDRVQVNLPYTVTIGDKTLQPGDYIIQQLRDSGNSRVLLIYSDQGMKFETSAMTIPALDINTARDTKVVLHHLGPDYYFDKIWIQGKDYGYEFPLPDSVKARERERSEPVSVAATYSATPSTSVSTATTAQATSAAANQQTTTAAQQPTTATQQTMTAAQQPTTAQAATQPQTAQAATEAQTSEPSANREAPTMPHTSAGWLGMLLAGGAMSGAGLKLRRRR